MKSIIDELVRVFEVHGQSLYFGEAVTETEHALQCAHLAERAGSPDELVAAALLHDIGHLLHGLPENIAEQGHDTRHEDIGAQWLARHFRPMLVDTVRLHVPAKRYLCSVEGNYFATLSPASRTSYHLQGGPMTDEEILQFEKEPAFRWAVEVRRWDDQAKIPGWAVPGLNHYRHCLEVSLKTGT